MHHLWLQQRFVLFLWELFFVFVTVDKQRRALHLLQNTMACPVFYCLFYAARCPRSGCPTPLAAVRVSDALRRRLSFNISVAVVTHASFGLSEQDNFS